MKTTPIDSLRGGVNLDPVGDPAPFRVGILTFHSQLNYGGVLQAWALQEALRGLGCDVRVIDRWFNAENATLLGQLAFHSLGTYLSIVQAICLGCAKIAEFQRRKRTERFIHDRLHLTPYHFVEWGEVAGRDLGLDCIVVGSDQVWRCGDFGSPRVFLLEGVPSSIKAITYAASFGMSAVPEEWTQVFRAGLKRFSAIGARESSAVRLVEALGQHATEVLDPTQLIDAKQWKQEMGEEAPSQKPTLVCYFLMEDIFKHLPTLEAFAARQQCTVEMFVGGNPFRIPRSWAALKTHIRSVFARLRTSVRIRFDAPPQDFVAAFASAKWILTESFHGLMFASIFGKNIRIFDSAQEKTSTFKASFVRLHDFAGKYVHGPLFAESVGEALESFARGERVTFDEAALEADRTRSRAWLRAALDRVRGEPAAQG